MKKQYSKLTAIKSLKLVKFMLISLIVLGIASRVSWIIFTQFTEEDAFITFRIAKNLAEGAGFVYNSGLIMRLISNPKHTLRIGVIILLVNLPWLLFAAIYFGSPIPYTIYAKWVAYVLPDHTRLGSHLLAVTNFMSPFDQFKGNTFLRNLLSWMTMLIAAWQTSKILRDKHQLLISLFVVLEIVRLVITQAHDFQSLYGANVGCPASSFWTGPW